MKIAKKWWILALISVVSSLALWLPVGRQKVWENYDGPYYVVVAQSWYDKVYIGKHFSFPLPLEYYAAHWPLYPLLIKAFSAIGYLNSMVLVNLLATAAAAVVIYKIFEEFKWGNPLWAAGAWLFFWPRMWVVRSIGSPETLFVLWVVSALYFCQKKRFWLAGIMGALAVVTKSPGILLFPTFLLASKFDRKIWPTLLIPLALLGVFGLFYLRMGDFWAYFHSGDNLHLQLLPFRVFDSNQVWVGQWWLEDILWIYLIGAIGVYRAFKKSAVWGWWGAVFYSVILFVSHRDLARYSLPLVPVIILGFAEIFEKKEIRWILALMIIPMYFYSLNFLAHNTMAMADWTPFFAR